MAAGADTGLNIKKRVHTPKYNPNLSYKQVYYEKKFKMTPRDFPCFKEQIK